jgi:hypothetical protein
MSRQEAVMPVKGLQLLAFACVAVFAGASLAAEQPRSMLDGSFDLKSAILSPAPFGPPSQFEPRQVATTPPAAPNIAASEAVTPRKIVSSKPRQKTAVATRKQKPNPLDANARDARRQTWPCAAGSGGICAWTR